MILKDLNNPVGHYGYTENDVCEMYRGCRDPYTQIEIIASIVGFSNPKNGYVSGDSKKKIKDILIKHGYNTNYSTKVRTNHYNSKSA